MEKISYKGPGFISLLGLLFIGLKLGKVIDWSWWWILIPLWGPVAVALIIIFFLLIGVFIIRLIKK